MSRTSLKQSLFLTTSKSQAPATTKITIVGSGIVGMSCAITILTQNICGELVLVDSDEKKVQGEVLDIQQGSIFLQNPRVTASTNFMATANSHLCILTTSTARGNTDHQSDMKTIKRNIDILKNVIPNLVQHSPKALIMVVTSPVDIMSYVAWKLSGLPTNQVFGTGTCLDSSNFRSLIAQKLGIGPVSCDGWIIGEHGGCTIPVWSSVSAGGVRLHDIKPQIGCENDDEQWNTIHNKVVASRENIYTLKKYNSWGVGIAVGALAMAVIKNTHRIISVSTLVKGIHGVDKEVFLSLPCIIGSNGPSHIIRQCLTDIEKKLFQESACRLHDKISKIKLT